jgi:hypothetical protein
LKLFGHTTSHNVEWRAVLSLLEATGSVEHLHNGKYQIQIGSETEVFTRPNHKDIEAEQLADVRRMLASVGYGQVVEQLEAQSGEV